MGDVFGNNPGAETGVASSAYSTTNVDPTPVFRLNSWITESVPRRNIASAIVPIGGSGVAKLTAIYLQEGQTVKGCAWKCGSTAPVTPTHWWEALCNYNRVQLAASADQLTTALAAEGDALLPFATGPLAAPYTGLYYHVLCMVAATMPTAWGVTSTIGAELLLADPPILCGLSDTGLTGPPANGHTYQALSANEDIFVGAF